VTISPVSSNGLEYMNILSLDQFTAERTGRFMIIVNSQFI